MQAEMPENTAPGRCLSPPARPVVLLVEDDPDTSKMVGELLEQAEYTVHVATHAAAALDHLASGDVDLLLIDVMLPEIDGLELCRWVRAGTQEMGPRSTTVGASGV